MATPSTTRIEVRGQPVRGVEVDAQTRCVHWHGPTDIIALRMKCCGQWFSCFDCHAALADHAPAVWPLGERDAGAVLCGACGQVLSIDAYLGAWLPVSGGARPRSIPAARTITTSTFALG